MIIDSHSHYDDEQFSSDRNAVFEDLKYHNVEKIINVGCNLASSKNAVALAKQYDFVYAGVGFHPSDAVDCTEDALKKLMALAKHPKVVCWGEIGLDYHYDGIDKALQQAIFISQMEIAKNLQLPVSIHTRDAMADTLKIVKKFQIPGVFHGYSGSMETAGELVKLGYYISFSGTVTYKNANHIKEVAAWVPADRYLVETDCPYLSPEPFRGTRNDSRNLNYTIQEIAALRNIPTEQVVRESNENTKRLFRIV